jgi:hypothetical protein
MLKGMAKSQWMKGTGIKGKRPIREKPKRACPAKTVET